MYDFDPHKKKEGINECVVATCNNVVFSYDLWLLDILSEHYYRIEEEDFDWAVSEIEKVLQFNNIIPCTLSVNEFKKLRIVPKDGGVFNPNTINNIFIYYKEPVVFGYILRRFLTKYKDLCYSTIPSYINPNARNYVIGKYNYFLFVKDNLVDDELILSNIFGVGNIQGFYNEKESILKALGNMTDNGTVDAELFFLSDVFWIEMDLYDDMVKLGIVEHPILNMVNISGKLILETPKNIELFKNFKEMVEKDNGKTEISSFSLSKFWDVKV